MQIFIHITCPQSTRLVTLTSARRPADVRQPPSFRYKQPLLFPVLQLRAAILTTRK